MWTGLSRPMRREHSEGGRTRRRLRRVSVRRWCAAPPRGAAAHARNTSERAGAAPDRGAPRSAACRSGARGCAARHRRHARADRPPRLRRERSRADALAADRALEALRPRRVRQRPPRGRRAPDRRDRLDRLRRQPRLRAAAARRDASRCSTRRSRALGRPLAAFADAVDTRELQRCASAARTRARSSRSTGAAPPTRTRRSTPSRRSSAPRSRTAWSRRRGRKVLEIRPPVPIDKGRGVRWLLADGPARPRALRRRRRHRSRRLRRAARGRRRGRGLHRRPLRRDAGRARARRRRDGRRARWACSSSSKSCSGRARARDAVRRLRQDHRAARPPRRRRRSRWRRCSARAPPTTRARRRSRSAGGRVSGVIGIVARSPRGGLAADRAPAERREDGQRRCRRSARPRVVLSRAVAAAALDGRGRRPRAARAADPGGRDRIRDHLGARLAPAARGDRRDRAAATASRFHVDVTSPWKPITLSRTPGFKAYLPTERSQRGVSGRVLLVSLGATPGLRPPTTSSRRASSAPARASSSSPPRRRAPLRTLALTDLAWALAARRAASAALARSRPRRGDLLDDHRRAARARARARSASTRSPRPTGPAATASGSARASARSWPARRCWSPSASRRSPGAPARHAPAIVVPIAVEPLGPGAAGDAARHRGDHLRRRRAQEGARPRARRVGRCARRDGEELLVAGSATVADADGVRARRAARRASQYRALLRRARIYVVGAAPRGVRHRPARGARRRRDAGRARRRALLRRAGARARRRPASGRARPRARDPHRARRSARRLRCGGAPALERVQRGERRPASSPSRCCRRCSRHA